MAAIPTSPGRYRHTPRGETESFLVDVVQYKEALLARLGDDDEPELHLVEDLDGTWAPE